MIPRPLTADQEAAVAAEDSVCLVVAPAGSGKTEVLIRRIVRLLEESRGQAFRILAVTFTLKAAQELQERVEGGVREEAWRVTADTIHGFALDWLLRSGSEVGVMPDAVVFSQDVDRLALLENAVQGLPGTVGNLREALYEIDRVRTDRVPREELRLQVLPSTGLPLAEILDAYEAALREAGGLDFPGMLDLLIQLLRKDQAVARRFRRTYRHLLVDEGQDLTRAQSELLALLASDVLDVFVVADDRQAIHAWAGGGIQWARQLVGDDATVLNLQHNFRCATTILDAAHRLAQHLDPPREDAKAAVGAPPGSAASFAYSSEQTESEAVGEWVETLLDSGLDASTLIDGESTDVLAEEVAVVARTRYALDGIAQELTSRGRQISIQTETNALLLTPEARILHSLLELRHAPRSRPAVRAATDEVAQLLPGALERYEAEVGAEPTDLESVLQLVADSPLDQLAQSAAGIGDDPTSIDSLLRSLSDFEVPSDAWFEDASRLLGWWEAYCAATRVYERQIGGFLRHLFVVQRTRPEDPGIRILTAHRAKGLEFRAVALIGAYQGGFPHYRSIGDADALAEERRAFYVSITRASRALLVSWPESRVTSYGNTRFNDPSQFIGEAGL